MREQTSWWLQTALLCYCSVRARGDHWENSDIDLLLISEDFRVLFSGERIDILLRSWCEDLVQREIEENFRQRRLQIDLDESETQRRSLELFRADRVTLEETGSSTLFLALGTLRWSETDKTTVKRTAPVALLPVELVRVRVHEPYKLRWLGEDLRINLTMLRKLTQVTDQMMGLVENK